MPLSIIMLVRELIPLRFVVSPLPGTLIFDDSTKLFCSPMLAVVATDDFVS